MLPERTNDVPARIAKQKRIALILKEKGYIRDFKFYEDPCMFRSQSLDLMPEDIATEVEILLMMIEMPILYDDIEELVTNEQRVKIRSLLADETKALRELDPNADDLYQYYESNKLQSSNLLAMLTFIKSAHHMIGLSDKTMMHWENARRSFNGTPGIKYPAFMLPLVAKLRKFLKRLPYSDMLTPYLYKGKLNNKQKAAVVDDITCLMEEVLVEIFHKYDSE